MSGKVGEVEGEVVIVTVQVYPQTHKAKQLSGKPITPYLYSGRSTRRKTFKGLGWGESALALGG